MMCDQMLWFVFCGALAGLRHGYQGKEHEHLWRHLWALHAALGSPGIGCMDL